MPHSNGRVYTDHSVTPKLGIDAFRDVAYVLGRKTGDWKQLCGDVDENGIRLSPSKQNKWAKFKPYRNSSKRTTLQGRINAFYGLSITVFDSLGTPGGSIAGFFRNLVDGVLSWELAPPRGGPQGERYRITDFDGYYHFAICPIGDIGSNTIPIDINGDALIEWDLESQLDVGNLQLTDLFVNGTPLSSFYLGILLYKSDTNYRFVTSDNVLGSGDVAITLSNVSSLAGTWRMYPFLSSVHYSLGDNAIAGGKYLSAGWDVPYKDVTFRLVSQSLSVYVYGVWNAAHTQIQFFIEAFNEDSASKTVTIQVILRRNQDGGTEPTTEDTLATYANSIQLTVPANGSIRDPAGESMHAWSPGVTYDDNYFYWLGAAITSGQTFTTHFVPIEESGDVMPD